MKCRLVEQGFKTGSCLTRVKSGSKKACDATLNFKDNEWHRLVKSAHLSRPEHYFSIYQSGCNHSCLKCHSWEFTQHAEGTWLSSSEIGSIVKEYEMGITVLEPREKATMWHGSDLCRSCGSCLLYGKKSWLCPGILELKDIVLRPQGFGPARNIVAFTGGDIACCVDFYCQATEEIKKNCRKMWVLLETNGFGLTPQNLDRLKDSGLDSFWLDIKAYDGEIYRKLCGTTNEWILKAPEEILKRGFVLEVLTLFIPGWVEDEEIKKIARLISDLDPDTPTTILAFFPEYKMKNIRSPNLSEMLRAYHLAKEIGLNRLKLGNCGIFTKTNKDWEHLLKEVGKEGIG